jgi:diguanylate cyclase (GGDEF)-like protein/PAS domain S-box-containing protein
MTSNELLSPSDVIDLLLDCICAVDAEGEFVYVSAASERIFGYRPDELLGQKMLNHIHPEDIKETTETAQNVMHGIPTTGFENRYIRKDGSVVNILWTARWDAKKQLRIAVAHDISERKRFEAKQQAVYDISAAAQQTDDLNQLFAQVHGIVDKLISAQNFFIALYDAASDEISFPFFVDQYDKTPDPLPLISGTLSAQVIGSGKTLNLDHYNNDTDFADQNIPAGANTNQWVGIPLSSNNHVIGVLGMQAHTSAIRYSEADIELLQYVSTQIASAIQRTQLHAHLLYAAGHDPLTGLANRGLLHDRLNGVLSRVRREHARFALLYLDLNKFKEISDKHGHNAGDQLLQQVAHRLLECVRESDTIARIGGDEFVILLDSIVLPTHAASVARKIQTRLSSGFTIDGCAIHITPSIGIAVYPEDGDDEVELLKHADESMYESKTRA